MKQLSFHPFLKCATIAPAGEPSMTHIPPPEPPKDWGMVDFLAATHHFMVVLITIFGLVTGGIAGGLIGSMFGNHEAGMLWGAILFGFWCFFVVATVSAIFSLLLEIARNSRDTVRLLSAMNSKI